MRIVKEEKGQASEIISLFQNKFGHNYDKEIAEGLRNVIILYFKESYTRDIGFVDESGNILLNSNFNNKNTEHIKRHEIIHKIDNTVLKDGEYISHFDIFPKGYEASLGAMREFVTEWINSKFSDNYFYMQNGDNEYVRLRGQNSSYAKGVNLVDMLSAIVGEEKILDVYTGKTTFEQFITSFEKKYANEEHSFKDLMKSFNKIFMGEQVAEEYTKSYSAMQEMYKQKILNMNVDSKEELEKMQREIQKLYDTFPYSLQDKNSNLNITLNEIQQVYVDNCNKHNVKIEPFKNFVIDESKKGIIKRITRASGYRAKQSKNVIGLDLPLDETNDARNNLYRIIYSISKSKDGIYEDILKDNNHLVAICEIVDKLPKNIENDTTLIQYADIYEYLNIVLKKQMVEELGNGTKGRIQEFRKYRDTMTKLKANSMSKAKMTKVMFGYDDTADMFDNMLNTYINENEQIVCDEKTNGVVEEKDYTHFREQMKSFKIGGVQENIEIEK